MPRTADRIELAWLVTGRWTSLGACVVALMFGRTALDIPSPIVTLGMALGVSALTNIALYRSARANRPLPANTPGLLVCSDVVLLAICLAQAGGVLNPVSIFFIVHIVLAALVLGLPWTWIVIALSMAGYGVQLLAPSTELSAAATMHPMIGEHMRGMWWAFVLTAAIVGVLVTRLALAIARRDQALARLRENTERQQRLMSLASMAAGAAHELSTPLGTIAVAAGELAHAAAALPGGDALTPDIELIRQELQRARGMLTDLSGRADTGALERKPTTVGEIVDRALAARGTAKTRVMVVGERRVPVEWPAGSMARALSNVIANALMASPDQDVMLAIKADGGRVRIAVTDQGQGMSADTLAHAGEPFFTTRPQGEGMGLGLFIARAAAEGVGGTMTIDSSERRGTTVTFDLPTMPEHAS